MAWQIKDRRQVVSNPFFAASGGEMTAFLILFASLTVLAAAEAVPDRATEKGLPGASEDPHNQRVPRAFYTPSWAVEITKGGKKMADLVARRNGFTNLGEVLIVNTILTCL